jgi:hypothetical protein
VGAATAASTGAGITFPATQSDSSDANTLDDYEEGTWTPTDASGAGLTFTTPEGVYEKIGRQVRAAFFLQYPATADGTNSLVGGLPFSVANANAQYQGFLGLAAEATAKTIVPTIGSTSFFFITNTAGGITNATLSTDYFSGTLLYNV